MLHCAMQRTRLQVEADRHAAALRKRLAEDLRRLREDAGASRAAVARLAGVDPTLIRRIEDGTIRPTVETYARITAALGADLATRVYPNTGPKIYDRHQAAMAEVVIGSAHVRWLRAVEVAVRRPAKGWIDLALFDRAARLVVATELESDLRRVEQLIRWSGEKADSFGSSEVVKGWMADGRAPDVSRLLVVRWTRANREAVATARRLLREAYPADPRDALESLAGTAAWPGPALIWARIDRGRSELVA